MDRQRFEWLVARAVESLPEEFRSKLENIDVAVEEQPTPRQLSEAGLKHGETLLGLYQGVPLTRRGEHYGMVLPDTITIFQKTIEARCKNEGAVKAEIMKVVQHEIAHHFGIGDARLNQLAREKD
jgi:predicted Zn-dependent protease with MMP-like domain